MKLKRFVLLGVAGLSLAALASCGSDEASHKLTYTNASGSTENVTVEKTSNAEEVLNAMKAVSATEAPKIGDLTSMEQNLEATIRSKINGGKMNADYLLANTVDLSSKELSINLTANMDVSAAAAKTIGTTSGNAIKGKITMDTYFCEDGAYVSMGDGSDYVKYKYDLSMYTSSISDLTQATKEAYNECATRNLDIFFLLADRNFGSEDAYSTLESNEDEMFDFIKESNVTVSSVTNDYIYFSLDVTGSDILSVYNSLSDSNALSSAKSFEADDKMKFTIGFNTTYYTMNYFKMDLSKAPGLFKSVYNTDNVDLSKFIMEVNYEFNNATVNAPKDKDSYIDLSFGFNSSNFDFSL